MSALRLWAIIALSAFATACSIFEGEDLGPNYGKTLSDLKRVEIPEEVNPVPVESIDVIEDSYRSALEVAKDAGVRHRILGSQYPVRSLRQTDFISAFEGADSLEHISSDHPGLGLPLSKLRMFWCGSRS